MRISHNHPGPEAADQTAPECPMLPVTEEVISSLRSAQSKPSSAQIILVLGTNFELKEKHQKMSEWLQLVFET